jgi:uncharacterized membrane protein
MGNSEQVISSKNRYHSPALFLGVFCLALALRLYHLGGLSLWRDEIISDLFARSSVGQLIHDSFTIEPSPPLYNFILHYWIQLFGDSEFMLRLPSAIFGSLAAAMLFRVGRRFFSEKVGFFAAILAALLPFQIRFGQEVRTYALFSLLAMLSLDQMPIHLKWPSRRGPFLFAIATTLMLYSHAYSLLLVAAQAIYVFGEWLRTKNDDRDVRFLREWILALGFPVLLALPWYVNLALHYNQFQTQFSWISQFPLMSPFRVLEVYFSLVDMPVLDEEMQQTVPIAGYVFAATIVGILLARKFWGSRKKAQQLSPAILILFWAGLSIGLPLGVGLFSQRLFLLRYSLPASLGVYLLLAVSLDWLLDRSKTLFVLLSLAAILGGLCVSLRFFQHFQKEDWRGAVKTIAEKSRPGEPIILMPDWFMTLFARGPDYSVTNYYVDRYMQGQRARFHYTSSFDEAESITQRAGGGWVMRMKWYLPPNNSETPFSKSSLRQVDHIQILNIVIDHFEK